MMLYVIHALDLLLRLHLNRFGIVPRTGSGLMGILASPLLHANWAHLAANSVPLFVLLILVFADPRYEPYQSLGLIWLISGVGTWLIGRGGAVHIGASSIIFGLLVYLIVAGIQMRSWRTSLVALVVLFLFGGAMVGILPQVGPISWEAHLSGAVSGFWAAQKR